MNTMKPKNTWLESELRKTLLFQCKNKKYNTFKLETTKQFPKILVIIHNLLYYFCIIGINKYIAFYSTCTGRMP